MKQITGNLLDLALAGQFDVIVHGCNCIHTMGAGIAKPISHLFPEALAADKDTPYNDRAKLGTFSQATIARDGTTFTIVNAYTQFTYKGKGRKADYDAIARVFQTIGQTFPDARIGYPMIGAGLAGGEWSIIAPLINAGLRACDHTLVVLP